MAKQTFTTGQVLLASQLTSLQQTAMNGGAFSAKTSSYTAVAADAGTAISMTSTSATTITINSGLFAAGDTILITNLGSGACVITAGTATVNTAGSLSLSQYEAGLLHFVSASSAVFNDYVQAASNPLTTTGDMIYSSSGSTQARLGIGSTSQVLTVVGGIPSWAAPAGGGKVLQVVQGTTTTSTTIASTTQADTNLTATITPTSASSKILVFATSPVNLTRGTTGGGQNEQNMRYALLRGATTLTGGTGINAIRNTESSNGYDAIDSTVFFTITYLDSPSTTSATTYKIQASASTVNQSGSISFQYGGGFGSVTLLEIGA